MVVVFSVSRSKWESHRKNFDCILTTDFILTWVRIWNEDFKPLNVFVVEVYFNTNPFDPSVHGQNPGVPNGHWKLFLGSVWRVLDRCLEMHSKWRYKICICLVILGELKSFRNYKGFSIIFLKIFDAVERFTKDRELFLFLSPSIFESEKFRFPFSTKISVTWGVKCEKL